MGHIVKLTVYCRRRPIMTKSALPQIQTYNDGMEDPCVIAIILRIPTGSSFCSTEFQKMDNIFIRLPSSFRSRSSLKCMCPICEVMGRIRFEEATSNI